GGDPLAGPGLGQGRDPRAAVAVTEDRGAVLRAGHQDVRGAADGATAGARGQADGAAGVPGEGVGSAATADGRGGAGADLSGGRLRGAEDAGLGVQGRAGRTEVTGGGNVTALRAG